MRLFIANIINCAQSWKKNIKPGIYFRFVLNDFFLIGNSYNNIILSVEIVEFFITHCKIGSSSKIPQKRSSGEPSYSA